jgi:hypothetical protein
VRTAATVVILPIRHRGDRTLWAVLAISGRPICPWSFPTFRLRGQGKRQLTQPFRRAIGLEVATINKVVTDSLQSAAILLRQV